MNSSISGKADEYVADIAELLSCGMNREKISAELRIPGYKVDDAIEDNIIPALTETLGLNLFSDDTFSMGDAVMGKIIYRIFSPDYSEDIYNRFHTALGTVHSNTDEYSNEEDRTSLDFEICEDEAAYNKKSTETDECEFVYSQNPLELLNSKQITIGGIRTIRCDPDLKPETIDKLKVSEASLLKQKYSEYAQLLQIHDPFPVYYENFRKYDYLGKTALALLVESRTLMNYSELIARYAYGKDIPFIVAAIMLEDLKKIEGGFFLLQRDGKGKLLKYAEWRPISASSRKPPVNYAKLYRSGYESAPGAGDRYTVRAYLKSGCVMSMTAQALGITRVTVAKRLKECGISNHESRKAESLEKWITEKENVAEVKTDGMDRGLPRVKETYSTSGTDFEILLFYYKNGKDVEKTAERYASIQGDMAKYIERLKGTKGLTLLAIAAADVAFNGDTKQASEAVDLTEKWYIRRRNIALKKYSKELLQINS